MGLVLRLRSLVSARAPRSPPARVRACFVVDPAPRPDQVQGQLRTEPAKVQPNPSSLAPGSVRISFVHAVIRSLSRVPGLRCPTATLSTTKCWSDRPGKMVRSFHLPVQVYCFLHSQIATTFQNLMMHDSPNLILYIPDGVHLQLLCFLVVVLRQ